MDLVSLTEMKFLPTGLPVTLSMVKLAECSAAFMRPILDDDFEAVRCRPEDISHGVGRLVVVIIDCISHERVRAGDEG